MKAFGNSRRSTVERRLEEAERQPEEAGRPPAEAEQTLEAIRSGEVDAIVVYGAEGEKVYTLQGAEHPYRILVETMSEGAATLSGENTILYCNQRFAEMLRAPLDGIIGSCLRDCIEPSQRPAFDALMQRAAEGRVKAELEIMPASGGRLRAQFAMNPLVIDGQMTAVCLIATDMTGEQWSRELVASEELARSILEQAAEAILVCDLNGLVIRASHTVQDLCGRNPLLQPFAEVLQFDSLAPVSGTTSLGADWTSSTLLQAVLNGAVFRGIEASLHSGPRTFDVLLSASPLLKDEEVKGAVVTFINVTEQKRTQQALLQQQEAIRDLSTPVLPVHNQLLIVPLIGAIDSARARQLTGQLLIRIRSHRARAVVLDLTGVPAIDSTVANNLIQTVQAAKLLGADVIVSGISRAIAHTLVELGVPFGSVETAVDLQSGIEQAEARLRLLPAEPMAQ